MANLLEETIGKLSIEDFAKKILWAKVRRVHMAEWLNTVGVVTTRDELKGKPKEEDFLLSPDHSLEEAIDFLKSLDFEYDDGYGSQEIFGTIMFNGSHWLERKEYDGAEWWSSRTVPIWK